MQVDEATVRRIAHLARIKITDAEAVALKGELNGILQWVEQLAEVDTAGVEPMTRVVPVQMKQRADVITDGHTEHPFGSRITTRVLGTASYRF